MTGWPVFDEEQIAVAAAVLRSGKVNYWTGEEGRAFEAEFAEAVGCRYGIALANGTLALELALRAFDIGPGDEVVVTPRSFMASASCVVDVRRQGRCSPTSIRTARTSPPRPCAPCSRRAPRRSSRCISPAGPATWTGWRRCAASAGSS